MRVLPFRSSWTTSAPLTSERASSVGAPFVRRNWSEIEAVAVHRGVGVRRVGVEARARDDARLAVRVDPVPDELQPRLEDEVALEALPGEVELVPRTPHVDAGGGEPVLLRGGVVRGRPRQPGRADVGARLELPHRRRAAPGRGPRSPRCRRPRGPRRPSARDGEGRARVGCSSGLQPADRPSRARLYAARRAAAHQFEGR